jgi:hypothetical protein
MIRGALASIGLVVVIACAAMAQNAPPPFEAPSSPILGGAGVAAPSQPPHFGASAGSEILRHRDFTGKPCLEVGGYARPHTVNTNLFDHVITVLNTCPQRIVIKVCYYRSEDCIPMELPGGERKEAILGTLPSTKFFRFEFREKF